VRCETKTKDNVFVTLVVSVQYQVQKDAGETPAGLCLSRSGCNWLEVMFQGVICVLHLPLSLGCLLQADKRQAADLLLHLWWVVEN
jgi:hypothetical protein